ncbi:MAG TPA: dihydroorotate dehydrogenase electron transfer subunit [Anaerolineae bacterium]|jgi:dihydroorotate dehydrogenase electron transfer subunit|nr:dihydroorotate dehydrogenase electron transfer subunit [Anaerolineae bacterium]
MFQVNADVIAKEEVVPGVFSLTIVSPEISENAKPGQFVHIACNQDGDFQLRRPFSIHRIVPGKAFEILFKVVGRGTEALSKVKVYDTLNIVGPLGNSFKYSEKITSALLIAGGVGVAPLTYLAEELTNKQVKFYAMLGAQTSTRMLRYIDFKRLAKKTYTATDDGSSGYKGTVVDLLNRTIHQIRPEVVYACGPEPMLKKIVQTADEFGVECQVSLETKMACGIGVCLGCACKTKKGYKMVCKDGPVFDARDIAWGKDEIEPWSKEEIKPTLLGDNECEVEVVETSD